MQQMLPIDSSDAMTVSLSLDDTEEADTTPRATRWPFEVAGVTHAGRVRSRNEDAYGIFPELGLCVVADGLGGRAGGEVASSTTVGRAHRFLSEAAGKRARGAGESAFDPGELGAMLGSAVQHANAVVHAAGEADPRLTGMATTFVGLLVAGSRAAIAHVGDSRAYRIREGKIERLTSDHSMRELYLKLYKERARPEIAEQNASIVTRAVGARARVQAEIAEVAVEPGDVFLLCSDGLWGLVSDEEMGFALAGASTLEAALAKMLASAYNRGGHDNITAVLVRCPG
ncbi:MAG: protein phosphatase 2C domain-containing protein [Polyangiaceae bacterium]